MVGIAPARPKSERWGCGNVCRAARHARRSPSLDRDAAEQVVRDRCNSNGCGQQDAAGKGLDGTTYCTIRQSFTGIPDPAGWASFCGPSFAGGETLSLRILNKSHMEYHGWQGFVFARITAGDAAMVIQATGNAGIAIDDLIVDPLFEDPLKIYNFFQI